MLSSGLIQRAIKLALKSDYYPFKISAIVFKSGRILAEGRNRIGSSSRINRKDKMVQCSIHAEVDALSKLDYSKTKGASLLIIRMNAGTNKISVGKPCEYCQRCMYEKGIKNVYFSNADGKIEKWKVVENVKKFEVNSAQTEHGYSNLFIFRSPEGESYSFYRK